MGQQQSSAKAASLEGSGCPVQHKRRESGMNESGCPVQHKPNRATADPSIEGGCSARHTQKSSNGNGYKYPTMYNVYSTPIDPTNQMPATANQQPSEGQRKDLSTQRVQSTIPKGGTDDDTWLYPSAQMFWNALVRKHKTEGVAEQDVATVVAIHNTMNENTWTQVLAWEELHFSSDASQSASDNREPKLLRFIGRPDELSPKARLKMLCGHPAPFDRHDWFVDRGGQGIHRYIIDYYHDESAVAEDTTPRHLTDAQSLKSIQVDVRPALDSFSSVTDRLLLMPIQQLLGKTRYQPVPFLAPSKMVLAERRHAAVLQQQAQAIKTNCAEHQQKFANCVTAAQSKGGSTEDAVAACGSLLIPFQLCAGRVICPQLTAEFEQYTGKASIPKKPSASAGWLSVLNTKPQHSQAAEVDLDKAAATLDEVRQQLEIFELDCKKHLSDNK